MKYKFPAMQKNGRVFPSMYIASTKEDDYENWEAHFPAPGYIDGDDIDYWSLLAERYAEDYQVALLTAITITGVRVALWREVFESVYLERGGFRDLSSRARWGKMNPDWQTFARLIVTDETAFYPWFYPCTDPAWLYRYGYTHGQYLADLGTAWINIDPAYCVPWSNARIGQDSPGTAEIRETARVGIFEADRVFRHARSQMQWRNA